MRPGPVLAEVGTSLRRNVTMTVALIVTVAISLALFGVGLLLRAEVQRVDGFLVGKLQVVVDLDDAITGTQRDTLDRALRADPLVAQVQYESKAAAFARFRSDFSDSPDVTRGVDPNALPASFRVKLRDPREVGAFAAEYGGRDGVDQVEDRQDLLAPLFRFLHGFQVAAFVLAAVQAVAALALIYNTIRVSAYSRRRETSIKQLVGATGLTVQLPFVLESAVGGLVGGVCAAGTLIGLKVYLVDHRFARQATLPMFGWGTVWLVAVLVVGAGVAVASLVSFATLRRHLRV